MALEQAAAETLARLLERVRTGRMDAVTSGDAEVAAQALWAPSPRAATPEADRAARAHMRLVLIAADVARDLAAGDADAMRADWEAREPGSIEIHDRWIEAASAGPGPYRAWVAGEGAALLERRFEALSGR